MNKLLLILFTLISLSASAQREIEFFEPDFDSAYAYHTYVYNRLTGIPHYNNFYSEWAKENKITKIHKTKGLNYEKTPGEKYTYIYNSNGYLTQSSYNTDTTTYEYLFNNNNIARVIVTAPTRRDVIYFNARRSVDSMLIRDERNNRWSRVMVRYKMIKGKRRISSFNHSGPGFPVGWVDIKYELDNPEQKESYLFYYRRELTSLEEHGPAKLLTAGDFSVDVIGYYKLSRTDIGYRDGIERVYNDSGDMYYVKEDELPHSQRLYMKGIQFYEWDENKKLKKMTTFTILGSRIRTHKRYIKYDMAKNKLYAPNDPGMEPGFRIMDGNRVSKVYLDRLAIEYTYE